LEVVKSFDIDYYYVAFAGHSNCNFVGFDVAKKKIIVRDYLSETTVINIDDIYQARAVDHDARSGDIIAGGTSPAGIAMGVASVVVSTTNAFSDTAESVLKSGLYINTKTALKIFT